MLAYLRAPLEICRISGDFSAAQASMIALRDFHVVDVERADREPAVIGEVEHRLGGHQWHSSPWMLNFK